MKSSVKHLIFQFKPYLRWIVWGGVFFFLAKTLKAHHENIIATALATELTGIKWGYIAIALSITLLAHCWTGWVWGFILQYLNYPVQGGWSIRVYLQTNIAKYVPGNVWHLYGRAKAAEQRGIPISVATLSVLLEPILLSASALIVALITYPHFVSILQLLVVIGLLLAIHPWCLNPLLKLVYSLKGKKLLRNYSNVSESQNSLQTVQSYPFFPLLGEIIFLGLRGGGFLFTLFALEPLPWADIPQLISAFSLAWLLGMIVPGSPGGIGIFETTAIALLEGHFLLGIALYRLISTLAEVLGAILAWLTKT